MRNRYREPRLRRQSPVYAAEKSAPTRQRDSPVADVGGELRRCRLERALHRLDDQANRLRERRPDLLGTERGPPEQTSKAVTARDIGLGLGLELPRRATLNLGRFSSFGADQEMVPRAHLADDRLIQLIAADLDRFPDDDPAERENGDLGRAAADVHDHASLRLRNR